MPHPEHAVDPLLGSSDGRPLIEALLSQEWPVAFAA
jgi:phosphoribosylformylglycinamidine (FGAM) synthase-like amidotransferase family enzyme